MNKEHGEANGGATPPESAGFRCRTCGARVAAGAAPAPFCSDRCRMADLHRWFSGDYRISRPLSQGEEGPADEPG